MSETTTINLKYILRTFVLVFISINVLEVEAQDTIVKRNDEKIISKILEVSSAEIKYKLFNYQEGPLFVTPKWELKSVIYGNGLKEYFDSIKPPVTPSSVLMKKDLAIIASGKSYLFQSRRINELEMLDVAQSIKDKKLNLIIKRTHEIKFVRKSFSAAAIALGGFGILTYVGVIPINTQANTTSGGGYNKRSRNANTTFRHTIGGYFMLAGLGCEAASLIININEIKHAHLVVKVYNKIINE